MKKRILILNTGGTISCVQTTKGLEPAPGFVEKTFATSSALKHPDLPEYVIRDYTPLIDSSNMTIAHWNRIAEDIKTHYDDMDGFIIFHGTDTMAYTASALSFMLENLGKPVILTGSQLPLSDVRSDGVDNTLTSLLLCAHYPIHEVCIYFNKRLLRGNRTRKLYTHRFDAFDSPNYPHLASIGIDITLHTKHVLAKPTAPFHLQPLITPCPIANFRLFPGIDLSVLEDLLALPLRALILETYGTGNAPNSDPQFLKCLAQACKREIVIVNSTQCLHGHVEMNHYATGMALKEAGVISGADMTPEAIHAKLLYGCSKTKSADELRRLMEKPVCGEKL
jgi:L-asparaginase